MQKLLFRTLFFSSSGLHLSSESLLFHRLLLKLHSKRVTV